MYATAAKTPATAIRRSLVGRYADDCVRMTCILPTRRAVRWELHRNPQLRWRRVSHAKTNRWDSQTGAVSTKRWAEIAKWVGSTGSSRSGHPAEADEAVAVTEVI